MGRKPHPAPLTAAQERRYFKNLEVKRRKSLLEENRIKDELNL